jgi:hypothetical protein
MAPNINRRRHLKTNCNIYQMFLSKPNHVLCESIHQSYPISCLKSKNTFFISKREIEKNRAICMMLFYREASEGILIISAKLIHRIPSNTQLVRNNHHIPLYPQYKAESGHPQVTSNQLCLPLGFFQFHKDNMQKQRIVMNSLPCLQLISCIHYTSQHSWAELNHPGQASFCKMITQAQLHLSNGHEHQHLTAIVAIKQH